MTAPEPLTEVLDQRNEASAAVDGVVPGVSIEQQALRRPSSTVFVNPDGTKTLRVYDDVQYIDNGRHLVSIDKSLVGKSGRLAPIAAAPVSFATSALDDQLAIVNLDGGSIAYGVEAASDIDGVVFEDEVVFSSIRKDADLVLSATASGAKELIILRSAAAPTTWRFPLRLDGLTPEVDSESGSILLRDLAGMIRGQIPAGWMEDSIVNPHTGRGAVSGGVRYELERNADGWVLQMELDSQWLSDPRRAWPVTVDPTTQRFDADADDTYVTNEYTTDNSAQTELKVGTYDGSHRYAAYLRFSSAMQSLENKFIVGASLNLLPTYTYSCNLSEVRVHRVTEPWTGVATQSWPGPAYDGIPVGSASFAGPHQSQCGGGWRSISIDEGEVQKWAHGEQAFHGFTLRASNSDRNGWKRFASQDSANKPYFDVTYSEEGASYYIPVTRFDPPVTVNSPGSIIVRVTNLGANAWTPTSGHGLSHKLYDRATGALVATGAPTPVSETVQSNQSTDISINVGPVDPGEYDLNLDMVDSAGASFADQHGVPKGLVYVGVGNGPPTIVGNFPANNGYVHTLTPTLWAAAHDPDNWPDAGFRYHFEICGDSACHQSGWLDSSSWQVPDDVLSWEASARWYVQIDDTDTVGPRIGPLYFTPRIVQPDITSHLSGAPAGADLPGVGPLVGNYSTEVTDATVAVAGPPLEIRRTYNSQDIRRTGAFGAGWTTSIDQRLTLDGDGSGNVVVTLESGRQLRFGRNPDGTYLPPHGINLTLVAHECVGGQSEPCWTLRDASGTLRQYDENGRLTVTADVDGRRQVYAYNAGELTTIVDESSGRRIELAWTAGHVSQVTTNAPSTGETAPTWTYSYEGDKLIELCTPLSATLCTKYDYITSPYQQPAIADAGPHAYWPLSEAVGDEAVNLMADGPGERSATYRHVDRGELGAFVASSDTAALFGAQPSPGAHVALPADLLDSTKTLALEVWFKTTGAGVIVGQQDKAIGQVPELFTPVVYVGLDGKLRAGMHTTPASQPITTPAAVNDGQWHHVVLNASLDQQQLYLDGAPIGSITGKLIDHTGQTVSSLGTGYTSSGFPGSPSEGGYFPFIGAIDDVAMYRHILTPAQIAGHIASQEGMTRLVAVTEPGDFEAIRISYDDSTGRLTTLRDRHGATWTLGTPEFESSTRVVSLVSSAKASIKYTYDPARGDRILKREDGTTYKDWWIYNSAGFVSQYQAGGEHVWQDTDARGNIKRRTTCRYSEDYCQAIDYGFYLNPDDLLDPRNDVMIWKTAAYHRDEAQGPRTTFDIDTAGRITRITRPRPDGATVDPAETITYSDGSEPAVDGGTVPPGLVLSSAAINGAETRFAYQANGDVVESVDPEGLHTSYTYDYLGRVTQAERWTMADSERISYGFTQNTALPA